MRSGWCLGNISTAGEVKEDILYYYNASRQYNMVLSDSSIALSNMDTSGYANGLTIFAIYED